MFVQCCRPHGLTEDYIQAILHSSIIYRLMRPNEVADESLCGEEVAGHTTLRDSKHLINPFMLNLPNECSGMKMYEYKTMSPLSIQSCTIRLFSGPNKSLSMGANCSLYRIFRFIKDAINPSVFLISSFCSILTV